VTSALEKHLAQGEIVTVDLPLSNGSNVDAQSPENRPRRKGDFSSLPGCGIFKDDLTFDDFIERMAEYRAKFEAEAAGF
jgi:hypothetical protein